MSYAPRDLAQANGQTPNNFASYSFSKKISDINSFFSSGNLKMPVSNSNFNVGSAPKNGGSSFSKLDLNRSESRGILLNKIFEHLTSYESGGDTHIKISDLKEFMTKLILTHDSNGNPLFRPRKLEPFPEHESDFLRAAKNFTERSSNIDFEKNLLKLENQLVKKTEISLSALQKTELFKDNINLFNIRESLGTSSAEPKIYLPKSFDQSAPFIINRESRYATAQKNQIWPLEGKDFEGKNGEIFLPGQIGKISCDRSSTAQISVRSAEVTENEKDRANDFINSELEFTFAKRCREACSAQRRPSISAFEKMTEFLDDQEKDLQKRADKMMEEKIISENFPLDISQ
jgi:hypothetical protein